jgi:hypothetical protein
VEFFSWLINATSFAAPKFTTCFLNILKKKMTGGETACFAPTWTFSAYEACGTIRDLFIFVKVGARFPRPQTINIEC